MPALQHPPGAIAAHACVRGTQRPPPFDGPAGAESASITEATAAMGGNVCTIRRTSQQVGPPPAGVYAPAAPLQICYNIININDTL